MPNSSPYLNFPKKNSKKLNKNPKISAKREKFNQNPKKNLAKIRQVLNLKD